MVPAGRVELPPSFEDQILSLARLPGSARRASCLIPRKKQENQRCREDGRHRRSHEEDRRNHPEYLVPTAGIEPALPFGNHPLKMARLPDFARWASPARPAQRQSCLGKNGWRGRVRTHNLLDQNQTLLPIELLSNMWFRSGAAAFSPSPDRCSGYFDLHDPSGASR